MRLQAVHDGTVYASDGRDVLTRDAGSAFDRTGRLPLPDGSRDKVIYGLLTSGRCRPVVDRLVGSVATVNVWPLSDSDLLATVGRQLFVSGDGGRRWEPSRRLPASSGPMGVLPSAVAHHDGRTYLGEYPLGDGVTPRVLVSRDCGRAWATHTALPDVRHVHGVQRDPYTGAIWVTTGDADAESRIGRLRDGGFQAVGGGSQAWRAVELAFGPSAVLWGMDCAYADANRIFKLPREELDTPDPSPVAVGRAPGSVYYSATITADGERWVVFSTAMEAGRDSTGPAAQRSASSQGVAMAASSASGFDDWHELAAFRRRRVLTDRLPGGLPRANGYVFLGADPAGGLLINPFNTDSGDGAIGQVPSSRFADLVDRPADY